MSMAGARPSQDIGDRRSDLFLLEWRGDWTRQSSHHVESCWSLCPRERGPWAWREISHQQPYVVAQNYFTYHSNPLARTSHIYGPVQTKGIKQEVQFCQGPGTGEKWKHLANRTTDCCMMQLKCREIEYLCKVTWAVRDRAGFESRQVCFQSRGCLHTLFYIVCYSLKWNTYIFLTPEQCGSWGRRPPAQSKLCR